MFFDTAVNGYYTLTFLQKELKNFKPLIPAAEKISDDVAPFIFEVDNEKLSVFFLNKSISLEKIIIIQSNEAIGILQNYFSRFVIQEIKGRPFYFRFWTANVFIKFIKTCDAKQLKEFFGPVQKFVCSDEDDPAFAFHFSFNGTKLVTNRVAADFAVTTSEEVQANAVSSNTVADTDKDTGLTAITTEQEKRPPRRFIY